MSQKNTLTPVELFEKKTALAKILEEEFGLHEQHQYRFFKQKELSLHNRMTFFLIIFIGDKKEAQTNKELFEEYCLKRKWKTKIALKNKETSLYVSMRNIPTQKESVAMSLLQKETHKNEVHNTSSDLFLDKLSTVLSLHKKFFVFGCYTNRNYQETIVEFEYMNPSERMFAERMLEETCTNPEFVETNETTLQISTPVIIKEKHDNFIRIAEKRLASMVGEKSSRINIIRWCIQKYLPREKFDIHPTNNNLSSRIHLRKNDSKEIFDILKSFCIPIIIDGTRPTRISFFISLDTEMDSLVRQNKEAKISNLHHKTQNKKQEQMEKYSETKAIRNAKTTLITAGFSKKDWVTKMLSKKVCSLTLHRDEHYQKLLERSLRPSKSVKYKISKGNNPNEILITDISETTGNTEKSKPALKKEQTVSVLEAIELLQEKGFILFKPGTKPDEMLEEVYIKVFGNNENVTNRITKIKFKKSNVNLD